MTEELLRRHDRGDDPLSDVTEHLIGFQRRLLFRRMGEAFFVVSAGAAIVAGVVWLVLVLIEPAEGHASRFFVIWASLGLAVFLLLGGLILWRRPTVIDVARDVEVTLGLDERLSTSMEIARGAIPRPQPSVVADALIEDTVGRVAGVDFASRRSPLAPTAPHVALAVMAVLVVAAVILVRPDASDEIAPQLVDASSDVPAVPALTVDEADAYRAEIETLAALVAEDATEADDPFLAGVAQDIGALAGAVEGGGDRLELTARLDQLADLADVGYQALPGASQGEAPPEAMDRFTALADQIARATETHLANATEPGQEPGFPDVGGADPAEREAATAGEPNPEAPVGDIGQDLGRPDRPANMGQAGLEIDEAILAEAQWGEVDPQLEQARRNLQEQLDEFAVQAVGAAQNAGRGAGDVAGDGQQPLVGMGEPVDLDNTFDRREEVLIAGDGAGEGARVRVDAAPDAAYTAPDEAIRQEGVWERLSEEATRRSVIDAGDAEIVARYFTRVDAGINE